jgi:hypothetical protein
VSRDIVAFLVVIGVVGWSLLLSPIGEGGSVLAGVKAAALRVAMPRSLGVRLVVKDWRCRGVSGAGRCRRGCG